MYGRNSIGLPNIRWSVAYGCNCTGTKTRYIVLLHAPIFAPIQTSGATSLGSKTMAGPLICRCSLPQMADAASLAGACANVTFILQHAGMLEDVSPQGRAAWRAGMAKLAKCPNVVSKLSGLGTFIHRNDPAHVAEILNDTVALFGAERCLFGSNFPIEKLWTTYRDLVNAHRAAAAALYPEQRDAIFGGTAARVYRVES